MTTRYTPSQMADYRAFVRVQKLGHWNMLTREAAQEAGLSRDEHTFVMKHYGAMQIQAQAAADAARLARLHAAEVQARHARGEL